MTEATTRGGADRAAARRARMVAAMRRSITERGYAATSLDHVIAEVGGSRRNIYAAFEGKAGLMRAVVEEVVAEIAAAGDLAAGDARDPRDWLVRVGTAFTARILDPEVVAILRELVAAGGVGPEDAAALWAAGPDRFRAALARWLGERCEEGLLAVPDVDAAALILPEMMRGGLLTERLVGRRDAVDAGTVAFHVERAVDLFLAGALPRPEPEPETEPDPDAAGAPPP